MQFKTKIMKLALSSGVIFQIPYKYGPLILDDDHDDAVFDTSDYEEISSSELDILLADENDLMSIYTEEHSII